MPTAIFTATLRMDVKMLGQSIRIVILLGRLACSFQVSNGRFPALMCFVSFSPKRWRALRMVWRVVLMTFYVLSAIVPTSPHTVGV